MTRSTGGLSTHVLDLERGRPAAGVPVRLEVRSAAAGDAAGAWRDLARGVTDANGRIAALLPPGTALERGIHRLTFDLDAWRSAGVAGDAAGPGFYPQAVIIFRVERPEEHHHVPLLWSPFGHSTYRGS